VKVGIMGDETVDGTAVVDYATFNEFGTEYIPARPFMSITAELYTDDISRFTQYLVGRMIDGKITDETVFRNMGEKYQSYIQKTIRDAKTWAVPNAESTIEKKGSTSPLIDTGRMVQSVRYEVK